MSYFTAKKPLANPTVHAVYLRQGQLRPKGEAEQMVAPFTQDTQMGTGHLPAQVDDGISGTVVQFTVTDRNTGQITDLWGSISPNGLFEIIDTQGKTHPLMHPQALETCLEIAVRNGLINNESVIRARSAHAALTKVLHTPHLVDMPNGSKVAQVMRGFGRLAQRFKAGAQGALVTDSQGRFLYYATPEQIKEVMLRSGQLLDPKVEAEIATLLQDNAEITATMAGVPSAPAQTAAVTQNTQPQPQVEQRQSAAPPTHRTQPNPVIDLNSDAPQVSSDGFKAPLPTHNTGKVAAVPAPTHRATQASAVDTSAPTVAPPTTQPTAVVPRNFGSTPKPNLDNPPSIGTAADTFKRLQQTHGRPGSRQVASR